MSDEIYTLGLWQVKPGNEAEFVTAWQELAATFLNLPQPPEAGQARLIQSLTDPTLFYSFGPWPNMATVQAMRADASAQAGLGRLRELCTTAQPGSFKVVAQA